MRSIKEPDPDDAPAPDEMPTLAGGGVLMGAGAPALATIAAAALSVEVPTGSGTPSVGMAHQPACPEAPNEESLAVTTLSRAEARSTEPSATCPGSTGAASTLLAGRFAEAVAGPPGTVLAALGPGALPASGLATPASADPASVVESSPPLAMPPADDSAIEPSVPVTAVTGASAPPGPPSDPIVELSVPATAVIAEGAAVSVVVALWASGDAVRVTGATAWVAAWVMGLAACARDPPVWFGAPVAGVVAFLAGPAAFLGTCLVGLVACVSGVLACVAVRFAGAVECVTGAAPLAGADDGDVLAWWLAPVAASVTGAAVSATVFVAGDAALVTGEAACVTPPSPAAEAGALAPSSATSIVRQTRTQPSVACDRLTIRAPAPRSVQGC